MPEEENKSHKFRNFAIAFAALAVAAFLAGFVPQYLKSSELREQLLANEARLGAVQRQAQVAKAQGAASLLYLEVTRKNYGIGAQHATAFFVQARTLMDEPAHAKLKPALESVLSQRDAVIANLAKPDPAVESQVAGILEAMLKLPAE